MRQRPPPIWKAGSMSGPPRPRGYPRRRSGKWLRSGCLKGPSPIYGHAAILALQALFSQLQRQGIPIGVFSDYPAMDKLRALGLTAQVIVSATCAEVNRLKPDPTGLLVAAAKLGAPAPECLFIGDQEAKDGECARRAGMPYLILASRRKNRQLHGLAAWLKDAEQS